LKEEQGQNFNNYLDRGLRLYGETSEEIHRFQAVNEDDYEHFSPIVRNISRTLRPDLSSGVPNWEKEREKYMTDVEGELKFVVVPKASKARPRGNTLHPEPSEDEI
jgi:hypothetical protein